MRPFPALGGPSHIAARIMARGRDVLDSHVLTNLVPNGIQPGRLVCIVVSVCDTGAPCLHPLGGPVCVDPCMPNAYVWAVSIGDPIQSAQATGMTWGNGAIPPAIVGLPNLL